MTEEFDEDVVFEVCIKTFIFFKSKLVVALSYLPSSEVNTDVEFINGS